MSDKEILEKAIQKAIANGWSGGNIRFYAMYEESRGLFRLETLRMIRSYAHRNDIPAGYIVKPEIKNDTSIPEIIYSHEFAKALWGEEPYYGARDKYPHSPTVLLTYQYHLQNMVIADDPIKYLGDHI